MPEISRFFGIIISIFYDDHNPPHFHARYGDYDALIKIEDFAVISNKGVRFIYFLTPDCVCRGREFLFTVLLTAI